MHKIKGNSFNEFDLEIHKSSTVEISTSENHLKIFIGKFGGKEEGFLKEITNAFVFVIHGIFEINNCLIESRTGLSLRNINEIEFEGLGAENIILMIKL